MQSIFVNRGCQPVSSRSVARPGAHQIFARWIRSQCQFVHCLTCRGAVVPCLSTVHTGHPQARNRCRSLCAPVRKPGWTGYGTRNVATAAAHAVPAEDERAPLTTFPFQDGATHNKQKSSPANRATTLRPPSNVDQKELHNYASRFGCIPKVDFACSRTKKSCQYTVTIELKEHGIIAKAARRILPLAYADAMEQFREQADAFCETNPAAASALSSTSLTTENAHDFLSFCRTNDAKLVIDMRDESVSYRQLQHQMFQSTPLLNGEPLSQPILDSSKSGAQHIAKLVAAVILRQRQPEIWPEFVEALKLGSGSILRPIKPNIPFPLDKKSLLAMRHTVRKAQEAGIFTDQDRPAVADVVSEQKSRPWRRFTMSEAYAARRSLQLQDELRELKRDPNMSSIRQKIKELPAIQSEKEILDMINNNIYSIVVGATGSGKTTQVPQILFDDAIRAGRGAHCNIITTQPRRIAATSVAARVAAERNVRIRNTVGYNIRFENKAPYPTGGITYSTTGILLTQLQHGRDELLDKISHLVIDEVHERDLDLDFLLITIKKAVEERLEAGKHVPKVVFMSATLDTSLFANYFQNQSSNGDSTPCPHVSVPGRTYPVREHYLEEIVKSLYRDNNGSNSLRSLLEEKMTATYLPAEEEHARKAEKITDSRGQALSTTPVDWGNLHEPLLDLDQDDSFSLTYEDTQVPVGLAAATIAHIAKTSNDGAILVFLPGYSSIRKLETILMTDRPLGVDFSVERMFKIITLHSSIESTQRDVFRDVPEGCRKIILSTNIAETSVTIPDIKYVVDTGKLNQKVYSPRRRVSKLACCWTSKSNCRQRAGRAGRVQDGNYYALFSKARFDSLRAVGLSEMQRLDLQEVCLRVKAGSFSKDVRGFLGDSIEPPLPSQVELSMRELKTIGALDEEGNITALGRFLSKLPLAPALGKMVVLGIVFRCLEPILILAAASGEMDLFIRPMPGSREKAASIRFSLAGTSESDHITLLEAFYDLRKYWNETNSESAYAYAVDKLINFRAFRNIQRATTQLESLLFEAGLVPPPANNFGSSGRRSQPGGRDLNVNSSSEPLIKAILLNALFPNLAVKNVPKPNGWRTERETSALIAPQSVNTEIKHKENREPLPRGSLMTFSTMSEPASDSSLFLVNTTRVLPLMVCLFGGQLKRKGPILYIDGWLPLQAYIQERPDAGGNLAADLVTKFREALDKVLSDAFRDLAKFEGWDEDQPRGDRGGRGPYLADHPARDDFAAGLERTLSAMPDLKKPIPSSVWNEIQSFRQEKGEKYKKMQI